MECDVRKCGNETKDEIMYIKYTYKSRKKN